MTEIAKMPINKKRQWITRAIVALLGIIVTILATWYTIYRSEIQQANAEMERARNVKENLVSIIEEHIINQKLVDCLRIKRLIELRTRDENLITRITVRDLIEQAEYNVLSSRYLDLEKKENYKVIFDDIYRQMIPTDTTPYEDIPNAILFNKLHRSIREQNTEESLELLTEYADYLASIYDSMSVSDKKILTNIDWIRTIITQPTFYILFGSYVAFVTFYILRRSTIRRILYRIFNWDS
jgi:hypothetical protein